MGIRQAGRVETAASEYSIEMLEPDAHAKRRAFGLALLLALLLTGPEQPLWRLQLVRVRSGEVVASWNDSHEQVTRTLELIERDLNTVDAQSFETAWGIRPPAPETETP